MKQQGAITLLVTTMVAVASLLFSLASYKNVFYQIKRTQNEVLTSQAHWKAEGGLECGYSTMKNSPNPENADLPNFFPVGCNSELGIDLKAKKILPTSNILLSSSFSDRAKKTVERTVLINSKNNSAGAVQTGSNMYAQSSLTFYNPEPGKERPQGWECVALKYRDKYEPTASIKNMGLLAAPNDSFNPKGKDCLSTHLTEVVIQKGDNVQAKLKDDFVRDPFLSPFKDFFGVSDANHNKVRQEKFDAVITQTSSGAAENEYKGFNCGPSIIKALEKNIDAIWIEGHCEITKNDYKKIVTLSNKLNGVMLLVHDGLFSVHPASVPGNLKYQGIVFHYNVDYKYNFNDWVGSEAYKMLNHASFIYAKEAKLASYYHYGAFNIVGGLILDAKHTDLSGKQVSQNALLADSLAMTYYGKYFSKFGGGGTEIKWLEGSWNDF